VPCPHPRKQLRPRRVHRVEPFGRCVLLLEGFRGPARSNAGRGSRFANDRIPKGCRERDLGLRVRSSARTGRRRWG
jgi:hypothetical protein